MTIEEVMVIQRFNDTACSVTWPDRKRRPRWVISLACARCLGIISIACFPKLSFARAGGSDGGALLLIAVVLCAAVTLFVYLLQKGIRTGVSAVLHAQRQKLKDEEDLARKVTLEFCESANREIEERRKELEQMRLAFAESYIRGRRWLADFVAEAYAAPDEVRALELELKKNPAFKAAEEVRAISKEKKKLKCRLKELEYTVKTYHEYYPVLEQYSDAILNEEATLTLDDDESNEFDRVSLFISSEEYQRLSVTQRNQLALDKWKTRPKTSVEIGRFYERYLGHLYESEGWDVDYVGAIEGLEDMGRDLICFSDTDIHIVQAKFWARHKVIHEKHIFQLYGTTLLFPHTHTNIGGRRITGVFATTTNLSDTAEWVANRLKITVRDNEEIDMNYPMIKCNVNGNNRIYHLPFDQQYDRVKIDPAKGESYALTVSAAERRGFRRAMRHNFS